MDADRLRRSAFNKAVRALLDAGKKAVYGRFFRVTVRGASHAPRSGAFLIASNHASHLDGGLIMHALGDREIVALAAQDYFFGNPLFRFFFTNFTNLLAFNRKARLKESLVSAGKVLQLGWPVLLFPEGTRTTTGRMGPFKASIGFLALNNNVDVLPVYLTGCAEAYPKGAILPRTRELGIAIGPLIKHAELVERCEGLEGTDAYRAATLHIENAVRALGGEPPAEVTPPPRKLRAS